jgi:hypothetical protein
MWLPSIRGKVPALVGEGILVGRVWGGVGVALGGVVCGEDHFFVVGHS